MRLVGRVRRRGFAGRRVAVGVASLALAGTVMGAAGPAARSADRVDDRAVSRVAGVPWRQAGPGWSVVEYSAASLHGTTKAREDFYLVNPAGRRYRIYVTPTATAFPQLTLLGWSGDRQRVLVYRAVGKPPFEVEQLGLATGTVVSRFGLSGNLLASGYTRPSGRSILAFLVAGPGIYRYSLTGRLQRVLARRLWPDTFSALDSPAGRFLLAGTGATVMRVSNAGAITRRIRVPASRSCSPVRWWTASVALADCFGRASYGTDRLWLVPSRSGKPRPLTPALRPHGLFLGYVDAWKLAGRLYLQADNDHDTLTIVRQFADGTRRTVTVPGQAGASESIVAAYHGRLLLASGVGAGGTSSLLWFNPVTRSVRFVIRAAAGTYGVTGVMAYGYWNH